MSIKCIIVDDEPLAIKVIENHLQGFDDFEMVATCNDAIESFSHLKNESVDLMFLDINMSGISGIDFIKYLKEPPLIVITTAYREYAVESFELNVFDYLVKPISFPRFSKTISKVIEYFQTIKSPKVPLTKNIEEELYIFIKADKKMVKVYFTEILYVESLKDYVRIVTPSESYITHHNLGNFTALLPEDKFLRIHRSYTIALDKIKAVEGNNVEIERKKIPIGRNYQSEIKKQILNQS